VAKPLNCTTEDIVVLVTADKLRPLGRPNSNAVKFFSAVELIHLLADRDWLDEATKTIGQFWKRKNARRNNITKKTNHGEFLSSQKNGKEIGFLQLRATKHSAKIKA
jgi:hypothetical protein